MTASYDFLSTQQKCLHTTFNLTYSKNPHFADYNDFFFNGHRGLFGLVYWREGGSDSLCVGWEDRCFAFFVVVVWSLFLCF